MVCMAIYKKLNEIQPMMIFGTQFCTLFMCLLNCPPRVANLKFLLTTDHITNSWPFKKMYFLMEAMQAFRSSWGIVVTFFRCGGPVRFINACVKLVQHCVYQKLLKSFDF